MAAATASFQAPAAAADDLTFKHAFGTTALPRPARRVVSLGYTTQDPLLALGVRPVAVRHWFGAFPHSIWPWARPYLGDAAPDVLIGEVSMERVAATDPDLIVAIGAGLSQAEYTVLSRIAPVLVHDPADSAYGTPWDRMTLILGRATGRLAEARELVASVRAGFAAARRRHPGWAGRTGVAAYHWSGETGAFAGADTRARFLIELGFQPTDAVAALSGADDFYARLSPEDLSPLDADILLWVSSFDTSPDLAALPMRRTLTAHAEGREVFAGGLVSAALSFGSVLSLPFALEALEADIAAACDGDPATPVASAVKAGLAP
ncbi:ABC transporter substrate-binding protein [Thalassobaculum sp. OXR-137]|uniref:ABC transporter substrate-binding protein n=1 Tax=Thalassobaculum sp. OXR-137 TaxID=3100173 RepID=UPI002AC9536B|nr:ABC transporter substrate-binding protein [Thalassobaculum sp. OXR-137]WPZ32718.1 ABC transporter substrate-binding protein [Thalassobaculum sp. OXR-137]